MFNHRLLPKVQSEKQRLINSLQQASKCVQSMQKVILQIHLE